MNYSELRNITIFIVDDNPSNLRMVMDTLESSGFTAVPIRSGLETLELVKIRRPDIILLDIVMTGGIDGFETCTRLKNNPATENIPVIFMSALSEAIDKVKGFDLGAVDFITKPVYAEELISRVHTHLKISRLQEELQEINSLLEEKVLSRTGELMNANQALNLEIEERKQTETALRESEEKFRAISESANDGIIIFSGTGKITFVNRAAENIFEYGKEGLIGKKITDVMKMDDAEENRPPALINSLLRRKGAYSHGSIMVLGKKKGGTVFPVDLSVSKIEISGERRLVILARDLSERIDLERRMHEIEEMEREKIARLEKKLELISQDREKVKTKIDQLLFRLKGIDT